MPRSLEKIKQNKNSCAMFPYPVFANWADQVAR